jgi:TonB family protein
MLQAKTRSIIEAAQPGVEDNQPRRLMLALAVLLVLLVGVVIRDSDFWFSRETSTLDGDATPTTSSQPATTKAVSNAPASKTVTAPAANKPSTATKTVTKEENPAAPAAPAATVNRTVLPPLQVEVIAGDKHNLVNPGSNATKVEIKNDSESAAAVTTKAADRERLQPGQSYEANYPMLAQHMNVKGSVVLQAVIGADGVIETLHVVSGPTILSSAAQQAVREWRFKPYVQNGQAVETQATITVNFTIKVDGTSSKTT